MDNVPEENSCSFSHDTQTPRNSGIDKIRPGNSGGDQRPKGRSSSPAPNLKAKQTDGQKRRQRGTFGQKKSDSASIKKTVVCVLASTPRVKITILKKDAKMATMSIPTCGGEGKPNKKSRKGRAKGSVPRLKESAKLRCVSQHSHPRHKFKIRGRKGPSRGIIQKCAPHGRSPCAPKFEE